MSLTREMPPRISLRGRTICIQTFYYSLWQNLKLITADFDGIAKTNGEDKLLDDPVQYQRLVGKLIHLSIRRPDIA